MIFSRLRLHRTMFLDGIIYSVLLNLSHLAGGFGANGVVLLCCRGKPLQPSKSSAFLEYRERQSSMRDIIKKANDVSAA